MGQDVLCKQISAFVSIITWFSFTGGSISVFCCTAPVSSFPSGLKKKTVQNIWCFQPMKASISMNCNKCHVILGAALTGMSALVKKRIQIYFVMDENDVPHGSAITYDIMTPRTNKNIYHDDPAQFLGKKQFLGLAIPVMYLSITTISPSKKFAMTCENYPSSIWSKLSIEFSMARCRFSSPLPVFKRGAEWCDITLITVALHTIGMRWGRPPMMYGSGPSFEGRISNKSSISPTIPLPFS